MGVFLSHPNHRSKPYLISALAGWRDQESARHTWVCPVLSLFHELGGFRSYHYRRMIQPLFPLREHQKFILCRCMTVHESDDRWRCVQFIQCQGCSITKEWMTSCNATSETLLPPELGLQDLQEPQRSGLSHHFGRMMSLFGPPSSLEPAFAGRQHKYAPPQTTRPLGPASEFFISLQLTFQKGCLFLETAFLNVSIASSSLPCCFKVMPKLLQASAKSDLIEITFLKAKTASSSCPS